MAVDMFINIDGIKGESKDDKHKDEIDIESWSWGLSQTGISHVGGGGGAGKVSSRDLTFEHYLDKSSPKLQSFCASGKHIAKAVLVMRKAGDKPVEYFTMTLTDLLVSDVSLSGSPGAELLREQVSLNFTKFEVEYKEQDQKGAALAGIKSGWDLKLNKGT